MTRYSIVALTETSLQLAVNKRRHETSISNEGLEGRRHVGNRSSCCGFRDSVHKVAGGLNLPQLSVEIPAINAASQTDTGDFCHRVYVGLACSNQNVRGVYIPGGASANMLSFDIVGMLEHDCVKREVWVHIEYISTNLLNVRDANVSNPVRTGLSELLK
jgi:hypothetical protein